MTYRLLNLACGSKVSRRGDWTNVDFQSPVDGVIEMNILRELSFAPDTFDVVYSSQFIEHLTLEDGERVLRNVAKVMKSGAVIRLVTPDLEELCQTYLGCLNAVKSESSAEARHRYDWARLEIFDQIVRDHSGGDILTFLAASDKTMREYIIGRLGYTAATFFTPSDVKSQRLSFAKVWQKMDRIPRRAWQMIWNGLATDTMRVGQFRHSGEVHRYLHDIYSLTRLLEKAGFHSIQRVDAYHSSIANWGSYELDVINGIIDGPMSLYVEARS